MLTSLRFVIFTLVALMTLTLSVTSQAKTTKHQVGKASWYGGYHHGRKTANGERFNMNALTAAHKTLPFGSIVKVTDLNTGKHVNVRITDRGPFHGNRILDLSKAAAKQLGILKSGVGRVELNVLSTPKSNKSKSKSKQQDENLIATSVPVTAVGQDKIETLLVSLNIPQSSHCGTGYF